MLSTLSISTITWHADFHDWLQKRGSKANTIKAYEQDVSHFCCWFVKTNRQEFAPSLMNGMDALSYRTWLETVKRCAPSTWNRTRTALGLMCQCFEEKYGLAMPRIDQLPSMPETKLAPKSLKDPQRREIMRCLDQSVNYNFGKKRPTTPRERWMAMRNRAMLGLMAYSALRIGETLALVLEDVRMGERKGFIDIPGAISKGSNTGVVPVTGIPLEFLREWLVVRKEMPIGDTNLLFPSDKGCQLHPRGVQEMIAELTGELGIKFTAHSLRHTALKQMVINGVPLNFVQQIARHKNLKTTVKNYTGPDEDDLADAVALGETGRR
jgi:integrase